MLNTSPFLIEAPIYDDVLDENNKFTDKWTNWFDLVTEAAGYIVSHDRFTDTLNETAIVKVIGGTTAERNLLQNAPDGVIWFNTTTSAFNFRQGGAWVTFAPIPA